MTRIQFYFDAKYSSWCIRIKTDKEKWETLQNPRRYSFESPNMTFESIREAGKFVARSLRGIGNNRTEISVNDELWIRDFKKALKELG